MYSGQSDGITPTQRGASSAVQANPPATATSTPASRIPRGTDDNSEYKA